MCETQLQTPSGRIHRSIKRLSDPASLTLVLDYCVAFEVQTPCNLLAQGAVLHTDAGIVQLVQEPELLDDLIKPTCITTS